MEQTRIIEVNGTKLEIDLRQARTVDSYKIGTNVKVLIKEYSSYKSYHGVIIGFDEFKMLPTIIICYVKPDYSETSINFVYYNAESKDVEICPAGEDACIDKQLIDQALDKKIESKRAELVDLEFKKSYFDAKYNQYFAKSETP